MASSHTKNSSVAYLKRVPDRKREITFWPIDEDTTDEAALKRSACDSVPTDSVVIAFQKLVYGYFAEHHRDLPWREESTPYRVLVSEVMLQQTQVQRVIPKFTAFLSRFPTPVSLACADLSDLLAAWQGLGYNRRALNLQRAARMIVDEWAGTIPDEPLQLQLLPGIGPYTAGAIAAFAFNRPEVFLETNIRSVLLHFFFNDASNVSDKELLPVAAVMLDHQNPRYWYNALMDYGSDLKRRFPNPCRRSRQHTVQSRFAGSDRQIRGAILRLLLATGGMTLSVMKRQFDSEPERLERILGGMLRDGFMQKNGSRYVISCSL